MKDLKNIVYTLFLLIASANAQESRFAVYDLGQVNMLTDIYTLRNGGYVCCGYVSDQLGVANESNLWLLQVDHDLNVVFSVLNEDADLKEYGLSVIEVDEGGFLIGGYSQVERQLQQFKCWRFTNEGELIWSRVYGDGKCSSVIELKDGSYLLAGRSYENNLGIVISIDDAGNVRWQNEYGDGYSNYLSQMRETEGGVVITGGHRANVNNEDLWIIKINPDDEGALFWSHYYDGENYHGGTSIVADPAGGFLIGSNAGDIQNGTFYYDWLVLKVNDDGEIESARMYDFGDEQGESRSEIIMSIERLSPEEYVAVGSTDNSWGLMRLNQNGDEIQQRLFDQYDNFRFYSFRTVARSLNSEPVVCGSVFSEDEDDYKGMILEFLPIIEAPQFLRWSPEDTVLTVLQGDTIVFSAYAEDQQGDEISTSWFVADTLFMQGDTTITVVYDSLGVFQTECRMSDGDHISSIRWHITVDDFFIASITPDSLRLLTRRGNTLPFTMDVACVEPDAPTVDWTVVNRDNEQEYLGEADTIEVCFDLAGEWAVEAEASWNGERESVRWVVDVRSAVWWWMPHEDAISVNRNEQRDFSVFAFDPDSDSLSIGWWLDGDSLDSNAEVLTLDFPDIGEYALVSIVRDGVDADTILWAITVNESGVASGQNGVPTVLALHPPAPNPFNSTTTIGFSLPVTRNVSLAVYDLSGREVTRLVDGAQVAGNHQVTWTANGVASGVYVVALDAGGMMLREKVVLVK